MMSILLTSNFNVSEALDQMHENFYVYSTDKWTAVLCGNMYCAKTSMVKPIFVQNLFQVVRCTLHCFIYVNGNYNYIILMTNANSEQPNAR